MRIMKLDDLYLVNLDRIEVFVNELICFLKFDLVLRL